MKERKKQRQTETEKKTHKTERNKQRIKRNKENKIEEIAIYTDNKKCSLNNKIVK